jgi:hypothetical protein
MYEAFAPIVTIDERDSQPGHHCEQCGGSPTVVTVIRWTGPIVGQTGRVPQQVHRYCVAHQSAAFRMWKLLVDTAQPVDQRGA